MLDGLDRLGQINEEQMALKIEEQLRTHWRHLLAKHVGITRQLLRKLLPERILVAPKEPDQYVFSGKAAVGKLLEGALPKVLASPTGFSKGGSNRGSNPFSFSIDVRVVAA